MKICQTLWCGKKKLISDSFGWISPQHHLMAWSYSVLKLREFYKDLELYTDFEGKNILIDLLQLPYSKVHTDYEYIDINPNLWAYPKILTYNRQEEPFIHIDGDIFIWKKFEKTLEEADLIAQNLEISTDYYVNLFKSIINRLYYIPDFFKENINSQFPQSFNAGILGGNNVEIIRKYSNEAIRFVMMNKEISDPNFNMIFEQLLFYSLTANENIQVTTYYNKTYNDNEYLMTEFADFLSIPKISYLHIIGQLKRNKFICDQMAKCFYNEYPHMFLKIVSLFNQNHIFFSTKLVPGFIMNKSNYSNRENSQRAHPIGKEIKNERENHLNELSLIENFDFDANPTQTFNNSSKVYFNRIREINFHKLNELENQAISSCEFFNLSDIKQNEKLISLNPYLEIFEILTDESDNRQHIIDEDNKKILAFTPQLFFNGIKEMVLDPISINIIVAIRDKEDKISFCELKNDFFDSFERVESDESSINFLLIHKLKYLVGNNIVIIE